MAVCSPVQLGRWEKVDADGYVGAGAVQFGFSGGVESYSGDGVLWDVWSGAAAELSGLFAVYPWLYALVFAVYHRAGAVDDDYARRCFLPISA